MRALSTIPYLIGADSKIEPADLAAVRNARELDIAFDVFEDACDGHAPPTFSKNGIYPKMAGTGVTRISTIYTNRAALSAIFILWWLIVITFRWQLP